MLISTYSLVLSDPSSLRQAIAIYAIMSECGFGPGTTVKILHEQLHLSKVSAGWIPWLVMTFLKRALNGDISTDVTYLYG